MTNTEKSRRWREKIGPEAYRACRRRLYAKNPVKKLASNKRWRDKNPDKNLDSWKRWRAKNREGHNAYLMKRYYEKKEHCRAIGRRLSGMRRARKRVVTIGELTDIAKVYERCAELGQWFKGLVVDHIIPLARGGAHEAKNLQIIYDFENRRKGSRLDYKPRVIFA